MKKIKRILKELRDILGLGDKQVMNIYALLISIVGMIIFTIIALIFA